MGRVDRQKGEFNLNEKKFEIKITYHAVARFKKRTRQFDASNEEIEKQIKNLTQNARIISRRPGNAWEVENRGYFFVVQFQGNYAYVITFLGDEIYRKWAKKNQRKTRYPGGRSKCWAALIS